jgi:2-amino-4-hydroxy-6-hydroxymethyldihydropteridine diphosphokinase
MTRVVYLGLGSNLQQPQQQVQRALTALHNPPLISLQQASSLYHSKPLGPQNQPDFINAVAECVTELTPFELLDYCQTIEQQQQRVRYQHWGPRTIDIDILLYGQLTLRSLELILPHPQMYQRDFVLIPLAEIAPDLLLPDGRCIKDLVKNFTGLKKCHINKQN